MYLLFVDESGTHAGRHPFVLGGLAVHEDDAARMQRDLDQLVIDHLGLVPPNLDEFEVHAGEMRNAKKPSSGAQRSSIWAGYPRQMRLALLEDVYALVDSFSPANPALPHALFGVVVDSRFRPDWKGVEKERFAYEVLLFTDSRATRLLQVADVVSYALYRRYNPDSLESRYLDLMWSRFDDDDGVVHGCVHYTPSYGAGACNCVPCKNRLLLEAERRPLRGSAGTGARRGRSKPAG